MSMHTEIEAKLKVDSHEQVIRKLTELGAEFLEEQLQKDYYFDDAESSFKKTDRALRLREQISSGNKKKFLTYKGPKEKHRFKRRTEIEIEVDDITSAAKIISILGYEEKLVVEKTRRLWRLDQCTVALDELPLLNSFVEIEGPNNEKITEVQKSLGLSHLPHILESYASLVAKKQIVNSQ